MKTVGTIDIFRDIMNNGRCSKPRGETIRELEYYQAEILNPWSLMEHRNYNIDYFKREFQWYLTGDRYNLDICKHAKAWKKLVQDDGAILSNYGSYWFGPQGGFNWVIECLTNDPHSRQAYIPMNNFHHAFPGNKDFVCTKGIQFRLQGGLLNMHVAMRSSDAIWGLGTDLPCFWHLWAMVAAELNVRMDRFVFSADSVHIYSRHYEMVGNILHHQDRFGNETPNPAPAITDPDDLIQLRFKSEFGKWLMEAPL
jgi:thymidylate synthase